MAINFPDSPVDGEIYVNPSNGKSWQWDATNETWNSLQNVEAFVSDTAPANPQVGALWFNTTNATMFVWYDDGDSQQWVSLVPGFFPAGGNVTITGTPANNQIATWFNGVSIQGEAELTWDGGDLGVGIGSPEATLHVREGATFTKSWSYSSVMQFISERESGNNQWINAVATGGIGSLYFADSDDVDIGGFIYDHATDTLSFRANNNQNMIWHGDHLELGSVEGDSAGILRLEGGLYSYATNGGGGYAQFESLFSDGGVEINTYNGDPTDTSWIYFDAKENTTGDFRLRIGRDTNTTGLVQVEIFEGDGTSNLNYSMTQSSMRISPNVNIGAQNSPGVSLVVDDTDAIEFPDGTTAQRPSAVAGRVRFNTDVDDLEVYTTNAAVWVPINAEGSAQAWAHGTSSALSADVYNVTSFVDNGVGNFAVSWTNTSTETGVAPACHDGTGSRIAVTNPTTSGTTINMSNTAGVADDVSWQFAYFSQGYA